MTTTLTDSQPPAPALTPLQTWTDLNLRMLDWMVSSSQQAGDQADRLARGGAAAPWQAAGWEWVAQAWQQWFDLLGSFARAAAPAQPEAAAAPASPPSRPRTQARGKSS